jgi:hypothetical protein
MLLSASAVAYVITSHKWFLLKPWHLTVTAIAKISLAQPVQHMTTAWLLRRRQALDRGGVLERANKIATGHNADDIAETILLNMIRGDVPRRVGR